jgi:ABC-2 type transport system permease protein/oleandomycin transport system permease protein
MTTASIESRIEVSTRLPRGAALSDARVVAKRFLLQLVRTPQLIVFTVVQTVMFLLLFRYVFGGSIQIPTMSYVDFLIPAYFAQIAIFDGFAVSVGLAEDAKAGLIERFRSLPMARSAFLTGRLLSDLLRQFGLLVIVLVVGVIVGFGMRGSALDLVAAFGVALMFGLSLFWVFAWIGLRVRDSETAQAAVTPFFLLAFVSTGLILVDTLPEWLQPFAEWQPLSQVTNAIRGLMQGEAAAALVDHSTGFYVATSALWSIGITVVFAPLAIRAYRKL